MKADQLVNGLMKKIWAYTLRSECASRRDGKFRIIYYSRIVKPNPESKSFFAIKTINMKAFITSLLQQKHNQGTSLLQCNTFKLSTSLPACELVFESLHAIDTFTKKNL